MTDPNTPAVAAERIVTEHAQGLTADRREALRQAIEDAIGAYGRDERDNGERAGAEWGGGD